MSVKVTRLETGGAVPLSKLTPTPATWQNVKTTIQRPAGSEGTPMFNRSGNSELPRLAPTH